MRSITSIFEGVKTILLFMLPGLTWWYFTERRNIGYWKWTGVRKIKFGLNKVSFKKLLLILSGAVIFIIIFQTTVNKTTHVEIYGNNGISRFLLRFLISAFTAAFAREILFRGALISIFKKYMTYNTANIIQAVLYGLTYSYIPSKSGSSGAILAFIPYSGIGYIMGILREKSNDSILPSWAITGFIYFSSIL